MRRGHRPGGPVWGFIVKAVVTASVLAACGSVRAGTQKEASASEAAKGEKLFVSYGCYECHGRQAQGGVGPHLGPSPISFAAFLRYVRHPSGSMPPYTEKVLTDQELSNIHAFLKSLPEPSKAKDIPLLNE